MQIRCSTHSVILNVMATQCTCSLNGICCPHWLVQRSRHCSHVRIPVHSPWLPGYTDVVQTILVLIIAGVFPDRPHTSLVLMCFRVLLFHMFYISSHHKLMSSHVYIPFREQTAFECVIQFLHSKIKNHVYMRWNISPSTRFPFSQPQTTFGWFLCIFPEFIYA